MLVVEDEFELIHCGNMSTVIQNHIGPLEPLNTTNVTNVTAVPDLAIDLEETPSYNNKQKPIDYSLVRLSDFNVDLILGNYAFGENNSNVSNFTDFSTTFERQPDFHINRYRRRPSHCHSIFLNENEYLPCSNTPKQVALTKSLILFGFIFMLLLELY